MTDFSKFGKITAFDLLSDEKIYIGCESGNFTLTACADCCSESWFEIDFDEKIIGKTIKEIREIQEYGMDDPDNPLPKSGVQEYDKNHLYHIVFDDDDTEPLEFYLRNSSNGYYDGWLNITECDSNVNKCDMSIDDCVRKSFPN